MMPCLGAALFFTLLATSASADFINAQLVNSNVDRTIDITSQLVKTTYKITMENAGKSPIQSFFFVLPKSLRPNVSFISCHSIDGRRSLKVSFTNVDGDEDKLFWKVDFKENLYPSKSATVELETVLTNNLTPHPAAITQREKQLVLYEGNAYFYSPYKTIRQITTFLLASKNIEYYSRVKPVNIMDSSVTYGPYHDKEPFSFEKIVVHFENNSPFLTVTELERVIEVSHWGNIAIEETIRIEHKGALLKNSFSRYDYQREVHSGMSSVKSFKTLLPAAATDLYYRDDIGNISTSHTKFMADSVELDLRPRFPLFGGWKTKYIIGYNVPSYEYLYNRGDEFLLKMRIVDHIFDDMIVGNLTTKIILPEGSRNVKLRTPYPVQRSPDEKHASYLDTVGRKVVVIKKSNLVENHIQDFELSYTFPKFLMLQEPFLAVSAFYVLFLLVIIYVRLDFSIVKQEAKKDE